MNHWSILNIFIDSSCSMVFSEKKLIRPKTSGHIEAFRFFRRRKVVHKISRKFEIDILIQWKNICRFCQAQKYHTPEENVRVFRSWTVAHDLAEIKNFACSFNLPKRHILNNFCVGQKGHLIHGRKMHWFENSIKRCKFFKNGRKVLAVGQAVVSWDTFGEKKS